MKVLVAVKRVVDYKARIRIKADGSNVDTSTAKMSMNPFDEIAVEEAIRLKEQGKVTEIVVIAIGSDKSSEIIRTALAMGADRGILLKTMDPVEPIVAAKLLKVIQDKEQAAIILLGKQAIDTDNNQVAQMLAAMMHCSQGCFASELELADEHVTVTREVDGGLETLKLSQPCVISTDLRLNEPRYIALPNIVKAKQKPLEIIEANSLGVDLESKLKLVSVRMPEQQRAKIMLESSVELIDKLKNEAHVL